MNSRHTKIAMVSLSMLAVTAFGNTQAKAGACPTHSSYKVNLERFKTDLWGAKYWSRLVITNPQNTSQYLAVVFDRLAIEGYTEASGFSTGLDDLMLERFKKVRTAGWVICDKDTTALGRLQLAYILENGKLNKEYSNRDTELTTTTSKKQAAREPVIRKK